MATRYVPVTPAGTAVDWLVSDTEEEAWDKLLEDAPTCHMTVNRDL